MKEITATDAARGFSALLTAVEKDGETFAITRGGRVVARVEPATGALGATVKQLLRDFKPDVAWADDVASVRVLLLSEEREWLA